MMDLTTTLFDEKWLRTNEARVRGILPDTWTHLINLDVAKIGSGFKQIGVYFRTLEEYQVLMVTLVKLNLLLKEGLTFRRNPDSVFASSIYRAS